MDVRVEAVGGEVTAWRWRAEADVVVGRRRGSAMRGAEEERGALAEVPLGAAVVISPWAAESLLVKEEMAHPAHEAASLG